MERELSVVDIVPLSKNMRVLGLPRKSRNGTRFHVIDGSRTRNAVKGAASVLKMTKDGLVVAQLDSGGSRISFHTKNKTVWPNGKAE